MPNSGSATYNGNWVANIQPADEQGDGTITRHSDTSSMTLPILGWTRSRSTLDSPCHAGMVPFLRIHSRVIAKPKLMKVRWPEVWRTPMTSRVASRVRSLGPDAVEAGGVFDYASKGNKDGAFRGSFGVARVRTTHRRSDYLKTRAADPKWIGCPSFFLFLYNSALRSAGALRSTTV